MRKIPDKEIIEWLQSGKRGLEDKALTYLFRQLNKMTISFVTRLRGNVEDAEDVLQEGLIAFFKLARTRKLPSPINAEAYLFSICKNI